MVSNEDREAAVQALLKAYDRMPSVFSHDELANTMTDAMVSHGWGPKPTVSRQELEALMPSTVNDLAEYLRTQVGIEVTD